MITRRPHDKERATSIASGNIFIYCENGSSIKRWTDGVTWSPSRIMGNFLIYRELNKGFPPGEKKRAAKKKHNPDDGSESPLEQTEDDMLPPLQISKDEERMLIGSLIESYDFKREGLVKKTISVKFQDQVYHLVSYYTLRHAITDLINRQPSRMAEFTHTQILEELTTGQNFRVAVDTNGTDVANNSNNTPPPSSGSPGPPNRYPDEDPYSQGHHQGYMSSPGAYASPSVISRYDVQGDSPLSYETSTTSIRSYPGYPRSDDMSHYSSSLRDNIPRSQVTYPLPGDYSAFSHDGTRSFSISSGMHGGPHAMEGSPHPGMQQGRSQSYSAGGHYGGMTESPAYPNGTPPGMPLLPSRNSLPMQHPLGSGSMSPEKSNGSAGSYLPPARQSSTPQGSPDDAQRPISYQIEDSVTFSRPKWS